MTLDLHRPASGAAQPPRGPRAGRFRWSGERGQASIEIVGLLPLIALLALVGFTVVASYSAEEQAGEAAAAGALALLQGTAEPRVAAREALPDSARARATVTITRRRVHVRVRPRVPLPISGLAARLARSAHADAGPPTP
jgi:type VI protein secretion system component VasK